MSATIPVVVTISNLPPGPVLAAPGLSVQPASASRRTAEIGRKRDIGRSYARNRGARAHRIAVIKIDFLTNQKVAAVGEKSMQGRSLSRSTREVSLIGRVATTPASQWGVRRVRAEP